MAMQIAKSYFLLEKAVKDAFASGNPNQDFGVRVKMEALRYAIVFVIDSPSIIVL